MSLVESPVAETNNDFMHQLGNLPNGRLSLQCVQCGLCETVCPTNELMDHSPHQLFDLVRKGDKRAVLTANTMWMCTSCYTCKVHCPQDIAITGLMHDLKFLAVRAGDSQSAQALFYRSFWREIYSRGKSFEMGALFGYYWRRRRAGLKAALDMRKLCLKMFRHRRIGLIPPHSVKDPESLQRIVTKAQIMQNRGELQ